jgi:hypothetical protein
MPRLGLCGLSNVFSIVLPKGNHLKEREKNESEKISPCGHFIC